MAIFFRQHGFHHHCFVAHSKGSSSPGYLSEDKTFYVETSIYSLITGKKMWSGTTTFNPSNLEQTSDEIITAVRNELMAKGLIKEN